MERLFNKFTGVINNKHIEIAEGPAYNGTYKRRHLLISKSENGRRYTGRRDHLKRMLLSFASLRSRTGSMSQYFFVGGGTAEKTSFIKIRTGKEHTQR